MSYVSFQTKMGLVCSTIRNFHTVKTNEPPECFHCKGKFDGTLHAQCGICDVYLHNQCNLELCKQDDNRQYCICPKCKSVGTLFTTIV